MASSPSNVVTLHEVVGRYFDIYNATNSPIFYTASLNYLLGVYGALILSKNCSTIGFLILLFMWKKINYWLN
jgi:hypothetical protein